MSSDTFKKARDKSLEIINAGMEAVSKGKDEVERTKLKQELLQKAYNAATKIDPTIKLALIQRQMGGAITQWNTNLEQKTSLPAQKPEVENPDQTEQASEEPEQPVQQVETPPPPPPIETPELNPDDEADRTQIAYYEALERTSARKLQEMEQRLREDYDRKLAELRKNNGGAQAQAPPQAQKPPQAQAIQRSTSVPQANPMVTAVTTASGGIQTRVTETIYAEFDALLQKLYLDDYRRALFWVWKKKHGYPNDLAQFLVDSFDEAMRARGADLQYIETKQALPRGYYRGENQETEKQSGREIDLGESSYFDEGRE